jgi:PilZ domain
MTLSSVVALARAKMTMIMPPEPGEDVSVLAPPTAWLPGQVTGRGPERLTIELGKTPIRRPFGFVAGAEVAVEWVHALGPMQVVAKVSVAESEPQPTLHLDLVGGPEPVERRVHPRAVTELDVSVWTPATPTKELAGKTVNLSPGGALLWLPDLASYASTVELDIALPGSIVHVSGRVIWRGEPGLVGIGFTRISPGERARLVEFVRESR